MSFAVGVLRCGLCRGAGHNRLTCGLHDQVPPGTAPWKAHRLRKKLRGDCIDCSRPAASGWEFCADHLASRRVASREYRRRRRSRKGLVTPQSPQENQLKEMASGLLFMHVIDTKTGLPVDTGAEIGRVSDDYQVFVEQARRMGAELKHFTSEEDPRAVDGICGWHTDSPDDVETFLGILGAAKLLTRIGKLVPASRLKRSVSPGELRFVFELA